MELLIYSTKKRKFHDMKRFKFQYGATNMPPRATTSKPSKTFKFQYGATNIISSSAIESGVVLFKFQYGATNINK